MTDSPHYRELMDADADWEAREATTRAPAEYHCTEEEIEDARLERRMSAARTRRQSHNDYSDRHPFACGPHCARCAEEDGEEEE